MGKKIIAAMSGGVDSSVTAALMVKAGYDVIAVTMRLGNHDTVEFDTDKPNCCSLEGVEDARRVSRLLDIPFYAFNYTNQFRKSIVDYFVDEYTAGRTPSPCVMCNKDLKFGKLLDQADQLGYNYVATGHYARIEQDVESERYLLRCGVDLQKDQSYFLFSLTQDQLSRAIMPLGELNKGQVRAIAREYNMLTADKPESQELCFIADDNYKRFLKDRIPEQIQPGSIVNQDDEKLGEHQGVPFYTIGQRRGLGVSAKTPLYVTQIRTKDNKIVVGESQSLMRDSMQVEDLNLISISKLESPLRAKVKIRYKDSGAMATILPLGKTSAKVQFDSPRRAITPGQAAVFYHDDLVIGGGWISK